ncbi:MAG: glycoside hydrolase family 24 protein [Burkholderiaceae bacterium]
MNERAFNLSDQLYLSKNLQAFLRVIREGETGQTDTAYETLVGGSRIESLDRHPNVRVYIKRLDVWSSAAGAYQFIYRTWEYCREKLNLRDFGRQAQDVAAVLTIKEQYALEMIKAGDLEGAIRRCAPVWASLPGDVYGQGGITMARAKAVFKKYGGKEKCS